MKLLTGRTRTLVVSGAITGDYHIEWPSGDPPYPTGGWSQVSVTSPWGGTVTAIGHAGPYLSAYTDYGVYCTACLEIEGTVVSDDDGHSLTYPPTESVSMDGTYEFRLDVEEVAEITVGTWNDHTARPRYTLRLYEQSRVGGTRSASITSGGVTATASETIATSVAVAQARTVPMSARSVGYGVNHMTELTGEIAGEALYMPTFAHSNSRGSATCSASSVSVTAMPISGDRFSRSQVDASCAPGLDRSFTTDLIVRSYDGDYPSPVAILTDHTSTELDVRIVANPTVTDSATQHSYGSATITVSSGGTTTWTQAALDESSGIEYVLSAGPVAGDTATLSAIGEDTEDTEVWLHCWEPFDAVTFSHASTWQIDACDSLTPGDELAGEWSAVGGGTVSVDDDGIRIDTAASGTQALRRTFTARWCNLRAGRYLRLRTSGPYVAGISVTLRTQDGATKTWSRDSTGNPFNPAGGTLVLDLANPDSSTSDTETADTIWPLPTIDGEYTGVTCLTEIELSGLQTSQTYRVTSVEVYRQDRADVTCLPARAGWELEQSAVISDNVTSDTYDVRGILAVVDGVQSIEAAHAWKVVVHSSGGDTTTYGESEIKSLLDQTGNATLGPWPSRAGWTITGDEVSDPAEYGDLPDWLNTNRGIAWMGLLWDTAADTPGWRDQIDEPASTAASLRAQMQVSHIEFYAGCGDALRLRTGASQGAFGGALQCKASAILRGGCHGLVFDKDTRLPADETDVEVYDTDESVDAGTGTSAEDGWYLSGTPFARGQHQLRVSVAGSQAVVIGRNRARRRVVLHSQLAPSWISYDVSRGWRQLASYVQGGTIRVLAATNIAGSAWEAVDTGIEGIRPCVRVHRQSAAQGLWLSYEVGTDGGTVRVACSYSEGRGFGAGTVIASGQYPVHVLTDDGRLYVYWRTAAGALFGVLLDSHLNTLVSAFTVVASGVDDAPITAAEYLTGKGVWGMRLVYSSSGALYQAVSPTGVAFGTPSMLSSAGKCPAIIHTADWRLVAFWVESGTGVQSQMFDLHGNALHDAVLVTSEGSMECLAADEVMTGQGAWCAHLYFPGGANPPGYVTTDGVTFSVIA